MDITTNPAVSARRAGLHYVSDTDPGITRHPFGKSFTYIHPNGKTVKDEETKERIQALAIPPAYTDVWICSDPDGHIQATGIDDKGRKQYMYHPDWRKVRDETKFHRMLVFGQYLPRIRRRVQKDLKKRGLPKEKVLAALIRLLEKTLIRVGNEEYVKENKSYGLTTLRNKHVDVKGDEVHFHFTGKRGIEHEIDLHDARLATIVRKLQDLPGQNLFQYKDEYGIVYSVTSTDVNNYLKDITGEDFTAKDFRTWKATVLACTAIQKAEACTSPTAAKKVISNIVKEVAEELGNTPAICRKSYIYPVLLEHFLTSLTADYLLKHQVKDIKQKAHLHKHEIVLMSFIEEILEA